MKAENLNTPQSAERSLIFISHATPQDNDFALWLGARLASAGYAVWSDVTKLIGGETHWDDISTAIRIRTAKFISVCTGIAVTKEGFKNELSLALSVQQRHAIKDFVIPVRLDDLNWPDFPTEIIRRNGIDFNGAWADGLGKLVKKLELDNVPRAASVDTDALSNWSKCFLQIDQDLATADESLVSNVIDIVQAPTAICVSELRTGAKAPIAETLTWPAEIKEQWAYSFAKLQRSAPSSYTDHSQLDLFTFKAHGSRIPLVSPNIARNIVFSLLRQAISRAIQSKGLIGHVFANGRAGYFIPANEGLISPRVSFKGPTGISGARALNGYSAKNEVFWHYTPELFPVLRSKSLHISISPHVIFSEDGINPLTDAARAHRLRRKFCKSWWQDRWRDLMLAYLAHLSGGKETFEIPLSESVTMTLSCHPELFVAPITAATPDFTTAVDETDDPIIDDDEDDEGDDMDGFSDAMAEEQTA